MKTSLVIWILATGICVASEPVKIDGFQGLGDIRYHQVESATLGKRYDIMIGLPATYDESDDTRYPTVYILDGAALYPLLQAYYRYLNFGGETPEMILVAISYSDGDWVAGNDRSHDYSAPSVEREHWGGAADFQAFLSNELLPVVESNYRTRSDRRVIFGQSMGGQFVLFTARTKPSLFWGHIASNPALHRNLPFYLAAPDDPAPGRITTKLFVGAATDDASRFHEPAAQWIEHWTNVQESPWELHVEVLDGHNHYSAPPASFRRGIRWLFSDP